MGSIRTSTTVVFHTPRPGRSPARVCIGGGAGAGDRYDMDVTASISILVVDLLRRTGKP